MAQIKKNILELDINPDYTNSLPADPIQENAIRQVINACFSYVQPQRVPKASVIHVSTQFLEENELTIEDQQEFLEVVSGNAPYQGFKSYAMCYGGHQFGHWAGQLGDGRAINIADVLINDRPWTLQLKGAGLTPYSRRADGLAVLRSSIREYLCSEAMYNLGVPTTRALSLVKTGENVLRDVLYNGNPAYEPGAIVCRMSPSFIRFGNFEILAAHNDVKNLKLLTDYTIRAFYPHLGEPSKETYLNFYEEVAKKSLEMALHWQRVGFVHGVMNTDNMSILGLTIDYGPYGWLEDFDPTWTPNTTDAQGRRYRFGNQPNIVIWNLLQLANAMYPLIEDAPVLQELINQFSKSFEEQYLKMMHEKLGIYSIEHISRERIHDLEELVATSQLDYTLFFRELAKQKANDFSHFWEMIKTVSYLDLSIRNDLKAEWEEWYNEWTAILQLENLSDLERASKMNAINPKYVLRNYMAQLAIEAAEKEDYSLIEELYILLHKPYEEQPEFEKWYAKRPDWAKNKVGSSMLSCSS